jgi:hypothetical protein
MKLVAVHNLFTRVLINADEVAGDPKAKKKYKDLNALPGTEFDTAVFCSDDAEAQSLLDRGMAKHPTLTTPKYPEA